MTRKLWRAVCLVCRLGLIARALWRGKKDHAHDEVEAAWAARWRRRVERADA